MKRIGIITFHRADNYGAVLQTKLDILPIQIDSRNVVAWV